MKRNKIIKIGVIAVITIFLFIWGISFLKGKKIFNNDTVFYVRYKKIDGLLVSNPVLINGFQVGRINKIYFADDQSGELIVELNVQNKISIPKNSIAKIYSLDLMGSKGISIIMNNKAIQNHQSGDTLIAEVEAGIQAEINKQILPLKNKSENLMSSIDSVLIIIHSIFDDNTKQSLQNSFVGIEYTVRNIQHLTYSLDTLITNNNELLTNIIKNFSEVSDSIVKADISGTINEANEALANVNEVMEKINKGNGTIALLLNNDSLYINLENATYNLNTLIKDVNENPKKYVHFSIFNK